MVCGPEIMMRFTIEALQHRGLALDRIFVSLSATLGAKGSACHA